MDDLTALLHQAHVMVWNGRPHRCRVADCSGLTGEATDGIDIWEAGGPPGQYHSRGRAVDFPTPRSPWTRQEFTHWAL